MLSALNRFRWRRCSRRSYFLFAFEREHILEQPLLIVILAVPIVVHLYFKSALAYLLNRRFGVAHCSPALGSEPSPDNVDTST